MKPWTWNWLKWEEWSPLFKSLIQHSHTQMYIYLLVIILFDLALRWFFHNRILLEMKDQIYSVNPSSNGRVDVAVFSVKTRAK